MPLNDQRRPELVAFGGVVVDHVEDHLDAGLVQRLDGLLELDHRILHRVATAWARTRPACCSPSSW